MVDFTEATRERIWALFYSEKLSKAEISHHVKAFHGEEWAYPFLLRTQGLSECVNQRLFPTWFVLQGLTNAETAPPLFEALCDHDLPFLQEILCFYPSLQTKIYSTYLNNFSVRDRQRRAVFHFSEKMAALLKAMHQLPRFPAFYIVYGLRQSTPGDFFILYGNYVSAEHITATLLNEIFEIDPFLSCFEIYEYVLAFCSEEVLFEIISAPDLNPVLLSRLHKLPILKKKRFREFFASLEIDEKNEAKAMEIENLSMLVNIIHGKIQQVINLFHTRGIEEKTFDIFHIELKLLKGLSVENMRLFLEHLGRLYQEGHEELKIVIQRKAQAYLPIYNEFFGGKAHIGLDQSSQELYSSKANSGLNTPETGEEKEINNNKHVMSKIYFWSLLEAIDPTRFHESMKNEQEFLLGLSLEHFTMVCILFSSDETLETVFTHQDRGYFLKFFLFNPDYERTEATLLMLERKTTGRFLGNILSMFRQYEFIRPFNSLRLAAAKYLVKHKREKVTFTLLLHLKDESPDVQRFLVRKFEENLNFYASYIVDCLLFRGIFASINVADLMRIFDVIIRLEQDDFQIVDRLLYEL